MPDVTRRDRKAMYGCHGTDLRIGEGGARPAGFQPGACSGVPQRRTLVVGEDVESCDDLIQVPLDGAFAPSSCQPLGTVPQLVEHDGSRA